MSVFMNACAMSVRYTVFGNRQKYECLMLVTTTIDMFYICSRVRYANFDLKTILKKNYVSWNFMDYSLITCET